MMRWPRSPRSGNRFVMIRIVLFLALIALAACGRGVGRRAARRRRAVVGHLQGHHHAAGVRARGRHRRGRGDVRLVAPCRAVAHAGDGCASAVTSAATPAAVMPSRKACSRSAMAIRPRRASMPMRRGGSPRNDPLTLLLHAQSAQLDGDRAGARAAFNTMAEREDTRLLGLRGLFIEAQRADDAVAAVMIAEEALKLSPASTWASHAVLGFRCAQGDWDGALKILDNDLAAGLIDKAGYRRRRGVLLTAKALELEKVDRDLSREAAMEAVKLAPTLVPAAVLAAKYESEAHQVRRAMRLVEAAWIAHPHPDLADAYAHVKLGDSARQRLVRVETLAAKTPGEIEGALAIARAAIDASEFAQSARRAGAVHGQSDAARGDADGRDRAHRAWRQRQGAGLDLARGARAARSGLDRGRLCQRSLAAGVAGDRTARRVPVADAAREPAVGQGQHHRVLAVRGGDAGRAFAAARGDEHGPGRAAARGAGRRDAAGDAGQFAACGEARASPRRLPRRLLRRRSPRPNRNRLRRRRCSAPAPISPNRPRRRSRRSFPSSARPTIPASTTRRQAMNLWNKSARPRRRPAAGAVSGPAGAGHKAFKHSVFLANSGRARYQERNAGHRVFHGPPQ